MAEPTTVPCEVWFYHLERTGLDQALPELLEKTLARGWRAIVRTPDAERIEHLDGWLWSYRDDSFLPHGVEGEPDADRQPVLLTTETRTIPMAPRLCSCSTTPSRVRWMISSAASCCSTAATIRRLVSARRRWKTFKESGHPVSYWRQGAERGWDQQA